jgi:Ni/Fe-hydrogenase subunit HybB-like protein
MAFDGSTASRFYLIEIFMGVIIPMILLSTKKIRESIGGTFISAMLVVGGVLMNRFNTNFFSQISDGFSYFPAWREIAITIGLVSLGVILYRLAVVFLPVFHQAEAKH